MAICQTYPSTTPAGYIVKNITTTQRNKLCEYANYTFLFNEANGWSDYGKEKKVDIIKENIMDWQFHHIANTVNGLIPVNHIATYEPELFDGVFPYHKLREENFETLIKDIESELKYKKIIHPPPRH